MYLLYFRKFEDAVAKILTSDNSASEYNPLAQCDTDLNGIIKEMQDIYESLARKTTSKVSKAVYQFFHREIKAAKDFCGAFLCIVVDAHGVDISGTEDAFYLCFIIVL